MRFLLALLFTLGLTAPAFTQEFETPAPEAIIMDGNSGAFLFEKNARKPIPPASMTKIMTIYLVFERLKSGALHLDDKFTVSEDAWRRGGFASGSSTMCLKPKKQVSVDDLIQGVIVLSGNDAAITLAENISGSEILFAKLMTKRAHELGLNSVNFKNATGWPDPDHHISLYDLARLAKLVHDAFPEYYHYFSEKEFDYCKVAPSNRYNRDPLLFSFKGADGLKTGHTTVAGYGLTGSAERDGKRRIVVVSGLKSSNQRARLSEQLMRAAFNEFDSAILFAKDKAVGKVPVALGKSKTVTATISKPVPLGWFKLERDKVKAHIVPAKDLVAPIAKGQPVGELVIQRPGQPNMKVSLVAANNVPRQGFFSLAVTGLRRMLMTSQTETDTQ